MKSISKIKYKKGMETREQRRANFDKIMKNSPIKGSKKEMDDLFEAFERLIKILMGKDE